MGTLTNRRIRRACYLLTTFATREMDADTEAALAKWGGEATEFLLDTLKEVVGDTPDKRAWLDMKLSRLRSALDRLNIY